LQNIAEPEAMERQPYVGVYCARNYFIDRRVRYVKLRAAGSVNSPHALGGSLAINDSRALCA